MKKMLDYINSLYDLYYFNNMHDTDVSKEIEIHVDIYIRNNFKKIKQKKYFYILTIRKDGSFEGYIDPKFEKELSIHYPEKLI